MDNVKYWALFMKATRDQLMEAGIGEEFEVSRLAGKDHRLLKEHYDVAEPGDKLIVTTFGQLREICILGEITYKDDELIKFKKTNELKAPMIFQKISQNEKIAPSKLQDELGTLIPLSEEDYEYSVNEIIGQDNLREAL